MKNNDYWFRERKTNPLTLVLIVVIVCAFLSILKLDKKIEERDTQIKNLKSQLSTNYVVFSMDSSCYSQITNSTDGVLRIKFNK